MNALFELISRLRSRIVPAHRIPLLTAAIGLCALALSWTAGSLSQHLRANIDWALYDVWAAQQRLHHTPPILLVDQDSLPTGSHGSTAWDRATLARTLHALSQTNATAIGLTDLLTMPSPPEHGGAASDALLAEGLSGNDRVVVLAPYLAHGAGEPLHHPGEPMDAGRAAQRWLPVSAAPSLEFLQADALAPLLPSVSDSGALVAHDLGIPDADGQWRRLPLFVRHGDRLVPAFGLALYLSAHGLDPALVRITGGRALLSPSPAAAPASPLPLSAVSLDSGGQVLLPRLHRATPTTHRISLGTLLHTVQRNDEEHLRSLTEGRLVILPPVASATESSRAAEAVTRQLILLESLLAPELQTRPLAPGWSAALSWVLSVLGALCLLRLRRGLGLAGLLAVAVGLALLAWTALSVFQTAIPLSLPILSLALAGVGTLLWNHLMAGSHLYELEGHVRRVQDELAAVRDALACQESAVDHLEEDLEEARTREARAASREEAMSHSAKEVQLELDRARAQEAATRAQLAQLETELSGLRAASLQQGELREHELESLRLDCERQGIFTRDRRLLHAVRDIQRGAPSSLPVLILGESGTGKELMARAVHRLSARHAHPFIAVNMAAISHELFESELFGHVRGSFSGALQDRPGYFELAHRGTIFLDEIGDLRPEHQAKLLRVLQEKTFYRVGATKPTSVDVRIVAATNKDLVRGIAEGWFRDDLYARLKGLSIALPPLRERLDDLPTLVEHLLARAAEAAHRPAPLLTQEAMAALRQYSWPRNVRELEQCLEQAVALCDAPLLTAYDLRLPAAEAHLPSAPRLSTGVAGDISGDQAVLECLRSHRFDMQTTARALGWDRSTVTQRLKGLCFQALVASNGDKATAAAQLAQDPTLIRTVELKLIEYADHLTAVISAFASAAEATQACRKRFKNLPDRHFKAVESLIRRQFEAQHPVSHPAQSRRAE